MRWTHAVRRMAFVPAGVVPAQSPDHEYVSLGKHEPGPGGKVAKHCHLRNPVVQYSGGSKAGVVFQCQRDSLETTPLYVLLCAMCDALCYRCLRSFCSD